MQRHQPHSVELGVPDRDQPPGQVDVAAAQRHRLAHAHAGCGQQAQQGPQRERAQRRSQPTRRLKQRRDLISRVDVRRRATSPRGQQPRRRDLMSRVERVQVAGEAAHGAEPEVDGDRLDPLGRARPGDRELDGHRGRAAGVDEGDEAGQVTALLAHLEAQTAPQPQVGAEVSGQRAHHSIPFGQGRAIVRSRATSTRA